MVKENFRIYNGFGITPSKNYVAAGYDFYVPNIVTMEQAEKMKLAMIESKRISYEDFNALIVMIEDYIKESISCNVYDSLKTYERPFIYNIAHLFISIDSAAIECKSLTSRVDEFFKHWFVIDDKGIPGINLYNTDHILVNSGIKVALDNETVGIFFNKSGRGNQGLDVRACVVDEDYSGYVHLSLAFTKDYTTTKIYAGDKLSQMVILPLVKYKEVSELDEASYNELMANSERGSKGFGSSNEKH